MASERDVIARARAAMRPSPEQRERDWARLQARLHHDDDVPELPRVPAIEVPTQRGWAIAAIVAVAAAALVWIALGTDVLLRDEVAPSQQAPDALPERSREHAVPVRDRGATPAREAQSEAPAIETKAETSPEPEPSPEPERATPRRSVPRAETADTLPAELALLQAAKRALAHGDTAAALRSLREHATRFPNGDLAEERWATQVRALCAAGRADEAARVADDFAAAHPASGVASALRDAPCAKNR